jgi:hypothetical protein
VCEASPSSSHLLPDDAAPCRWFPAPHRQVARSAQSHRQHRQTVCLDSMHRIYTQNLYTKSMHGFHARIPYTASLHQSLAPELNVWGPPVFRHCELSAHQPHEPRLSLRSVNACKLRPPASNLISDGISPVACSRGHQLRHPCLLPLRRPCAEYGR